jgi:hypothetical protein
MRNLQGAATAVDRHGAFALEPGYALGNTGPITKLSRSVDPVSERLLQRAIVDRSLGGVGDPQTVAGYMSASVAVPAGYAGGPAAAPVVPTAGLTPPDCCG